MANGTVAAGSEHNAFRYGIAKNSNFARIVKLGIFARLAKFPNFAISQYFSLG